MMGRIIVFCGVSGAGKTFFEDAILSNFSVTERLLTVTNRKKKKGEVDGVDNIFLTSSKFEEAKQNDEIFFERPYKKSKKLAFRKSDLDKCENGITLITEVSVENLEKFVMDENIKKRNIEVISIYILPKHLNEATQKLQERGLKKKDLLERIAQNKYDLKGMNFDMFDYLIINDYSTRCKESIFKIIEQR